MAPDLCPGLLSQGSEWLAPSCSPAECWATHCFLSAAVTCRSRHSPCLLPSMCISCQSVCGSVCCLLPFSIKLSLAGLGPSKKSCSELRDLVAGPLISLPSPIPSSAFSTQLPCTLEWANRRDWDEMSDSHTLQQGLWVCECPVGSR